MPLLAIETTCDETAAAVVSRQRQVLSSVVASQEMLHARWHGVVPEVASRAHVERIVPVVDEAVRQAGVGLDAIEAVAVAIRPGLVGSLLVGISAAKMLALVLGKPLVGYDHVAAHLYACRMAHPTRMRYPCVGLVASGGHTSLFRVTSPLELHRLGGTIDDAIGEAFDKASSLLGLGYPGGPAIEWAARGGDPTAHRFPRPLARDHETLDMSFSGLKTALRYRVRPPGGTADIPLPTGQPLADLAASFQQAAVDTVLAKVRLAIERTSADLLTIGGGVTANTLLRETLTAFATAAGIELLMPPRELCTDNAAMGGIAWERIERGKTDDLALDVVPGLERGSPSRPAQ
jgi:N6-L-threonylcarbamoyladenine synthase